MGRDKLWKELEEYGVKCRLLKAIRSLYEKSEACVRVKGEMSSWLPIMHARSDAGLCYVNGCLPNKTASERGNGEFYIKEVN